MLGERAPVNLHQANGAIQAEAAVWLRARGVAWSPPADASRASDADDED